MEKIAFTMQLNPGQRDEYKRRHDEIQDDLKTLLLQAGIRDYSIFLDEKNHVLFAVLRRTKNHHMDELPSHEVMRRWWEFMAPIMETHDTNEPVVHPLEMMFHMD